MTRLWCIRAEGTRYTSAFLAGGYAAIGWLAEDLTGLPTKEEIFPLYRRTYPNDSNLVVGQQVGQIARFRFEILPGDYAFTPSEETEWLHYGQVIPPAADSHPSSSSYYFESSDSSCPYPHRIRIKWSGERLNRSQLSVPFQNTLRAARAVFEISHADEFFALIKAARNPPPRYDPYKTVLEQILQLDAKEFEELIKELLAALGFDYSEVTGRSGDGGVDVRGELDVYGLAKIKLYVQAKRYQLDSKIPAGTVRQLRAAIPAGGQGAFITTADFRPAAAEVASEPGFPRIGLINGRRLVDLLVEHWTDIPEDYREKLGLRPGLVRI